MTPAVKGTYSRRTLKLRKHEAKSPGSHKSHALDCHGLILKINSFVFNLRQLVRACYTEIVF